MSQLWIVVGALSAFVSVACGAFGAHGLKDRLTPYALSIWNTAAQYQMYHALALIVFGVWVKGAASQSQASASAWAFAVGTVLFSGSLYALALTDIKWLGAITPLGGLLFLFGWGSFAWIVFKQ